MKNVRLTYQGNGHWILWSDQTMVAYVNDTGGNVVEVNVIPDDDDEECA